MATSKLKVLCGISFVLFTLNLMINNYFKNIFFIFNLIYISIVIVYVYRLYSKDVVTRKELIKYLLPILLFAVISSIFFVLPYFEKY
ncbi:Hypothetical transmembrane protein [Flavobacterium indicum GPTSA100-9 = DSM 17447]|uniref:Hypothetical transmembrane protein n=1 Tax=Flavobacterium indicum (strain DSM 17447 / CIP 109464 / GPTSA100-9) TaxID=1094466 RepID=H8XRA5_FLAIG|nr:Hypothetical transmembrane protein [Flavobacterium indicum GPTSA100-9 = DSM 17447]